MLLCLLPPLLPLIIFFSECTSPPLANLIIPLGEVHFVTYTKYIFVRAKDAVSSMIMPLHWRRQHVLLKGEGKTKAWSEPHTMPPERMRQEVWAAFLSRLANCAFHGMGGTRARLSRRGGASCYPLPSFRPFLRIAESEIASMGHKVEVFLAFPLDWRNSMGKSVHVYTDFMIDLSTKENGLFPHFPSDSLWIVVILTIYPSFTLWFKT